MRVPLTDLNKVKCSCEKDVHADCSAMPSFEVVEVAQLLGLFWNMGKLHESSRKYFARRFMGMEQFYMKSGFLS